MPPRGRCPRSPPMAPMHSWKVAERRAPSSSLQPRMLINRRSSESATTVPFSLRRKSAMPRRRPSTTGLANTLPRPTLRRRRLIRTAASPRRYLFRRARTTRTRRRGRSRGRSRHRATTGRLCLRSRSTHRHFLHGRNQNQASSGPRCRHGRSQNQESSGPRFLHGRSQDQESSGRRSRHGRSQNQESSGRRSRHGHNRSQESSGLRSRSTSTRRRCRHGSGRQHRLSTARRKNTHLGWRRLFQRTTDACVQRTGTQARDFALAGGHQIFVRQE